MIKNKIIFSEKQRQKPVWVWLILIIIFLIFLYTFIRQIVFNSPVANQVSSNWSMYLNLGLMLLLAYLFHRVGLYLLIKEDGIYYRFTPFHFRWRCIYFSQINRVYVREYKPIREYGGWGWRLGLGGQGRALSVKGNYGLQLELKTGKKILFGTQKPEEIKKVLASENLQKKLI